MHFPPTLRYFHKNNARNIIYMAVLIFLKNLDLRKNTYSQTTSWRLNLRLMFVKVSGEQRFPDILLEYRRMKLPAPGLRMSINLRVTGRAAAPGWPGPELLLRPAAEC